MLRAKGFTLIELLVVIAIIGILSSVVLASLNSARKKSNVAAIKPEVNEFVKVLELEYNESGTYTALNKGWVGTLNNCTSVGYVGNYASQAVKICDGIISAITNRGANDFYTGVNVSTGFSNSSQYSIIARLPDGTYFCRGSSGRSSEGNVNNGSWLGAGCYGNP